ncbi:MAG TPA: hypothetical protein PLM93_02345 [Sulfuricurvum sp.]|nr:MAG: hypothetical protein B7Y30_08015 [Campylobacterales bacterium 16-40-21]OZA04011.1 MAG: hypothetical protein B7X89_00200 [Sulfuricurvum sp. 17-40-25]HQS66011.1 hypothetical protein [Sulfuricurvum sp.]HQT37054.1 hypothetical protein [Sulfuricurvum sp.]
MENINTILKKYNNFKDAQLRSIEPLSDSSKVLTLVIQDDDGEDINTIKIEFNNITKSQILDNSVLSYMDMGFGISLIKEHDLYGFALGKGTAMLHVHNAPLYIIASEVKIQEI